MQTEPHETHLTAKRGIRVFLSYSHKDEALKLLLQEHLRVLERTGVIDIWSDRELMPGQKFEASIRKNIRKCELFIALVSSAYLASNYCIDIELAEALQRHGKQGEGIVPIILRPCAWKSLPALATRNALPKDGVPLASLPELDAACEQVVVSLSKLALQKRFDNKYDESRAVWQLCGTTEINEIGRRVVFVNRLRILTEDISLFAHRASAGTRMIIESTAEALSRISRLRVEDLGRRLGTEIFSVEGLDWNANLHLQHGADSAHLPPMLEPDRLLGNTGELLLTATASKEELASGGYRSHRLRSVAFNHRRDGKITTSYDCGNLRDDSIVAVREEIQDAHALLFEFLTFQSAKLRASVHWDPQRAYLDKDFAASLAGTTLFECDYLFKRIALDLLSPRHPLGREFWSAVLDNFGGRKSSRRRSLFFAPIIEVYPKKVVLVTANQPDDPLLEKFWPPHDPGDSYRLNVLTKNEMGVRIVGSISPEQVAVGDPSLKDSLARKGLQFGDLESLNVAGRNALEKIVFPVLEGELNSGWMLERYSSSFAALSLAYGMKEEIGTWSAGNKRQSLMGDVVDSNDTRLLDQIRFDSATHLRLGSKLVGTARYDDAAARKLFRTLGTWSTVKMKKPTEQSLEVCYYVVGSADFTGIDVCEGVGSRE